MILTWIDVHEHATAWVEMKHFQLYVVVILHHMVCLLKFVLSVNRAVAGSGYKVNNVLLLQVISGKAEIFGTELTKNKRYNFASGSKVAIFTWNGCKLTISFQQAICMHN